MIRNFKDRRTRLFFEGKRVAAFHGFSDQAVRRLTVLDSAEALGDLAALPSNRLEKLRGDRGRTAQHPDQRAVAHLLPLDRGRAERSRDRGLPLKGDDMNATSGMRAVHPGEVLREELDEIGLSANALSKALGVPVNRVTMILNGQRGVSADTALRLARYFGTTPQLWLNLQKTWELRRAEIEGGRAIAEQVTPRRAVG